MSEGSTIFPLAVSNLTVRKRGKTILNDINVTLERSGFTIVMGPNGSGKTTLLRVMHGLERPRQGEVRWSINTRDAQARQAFVFQTPVMMRRSVLDNVAYPLMLRSQSRAQARQAARHWVETVGLHNKFNLDAKMLSGGERQKLAIARGLICSPDVLFLDEPTTNLDGRSIREIEAIVTAANAQGTRVIMTTHDIGQARRLASEVIFLNKGEVCEQQSSESFFNNPQSVAAQAYLRGDIVE